MADPEILKINAGYVLRNKSRRKRTRLPAEVIALLTPEAQAKHLAETEDPMEVDDDPALNPDVVGDVDVDDGLGDLIFVMDDGQGGEQILNLGNEPMDDDVGIGELIINVNEAGDFNVKGLLS